MEQEDLSLFGTESILEETVDTGIKLNLIKFKALKVDSVEKWQDLFAGFTGMKVITFSSSLRMIRYFCRQFAKLEIIFGNEQVLGGKMDLLAEQFGLLRALRKENAQGRKVISEKMAEGGLHLFVTKVDGVTSHQKIFLLAQPEEGRYRVG